MPHVDAALICALGGPAKVARRLRLKGFGVQRVQNWMARGIPPKVKIEHPDLFMAPALARSRFRKLQQHLDAALQRVELAMAASHNCLITDRPDLPRSEETCWTTDFRKEIQAVQDARSALAALVVDGKPSR